MTGCDTEADRDMDEPETAEYMDFAPKTLANWRSKKLYDLKPEKKGGATIYKLSVVNRFLISCGMPDRGLLTYSPVKSRKNAARHIDKSPGTLATWTPANEHQLDPFKIGGTVRYPVLSLERYLDELMSP